MKSAFSQESLRSITHSLGRFLAIAAIVALGAGFYAGLRMTAPDMNLAADSYYDGTDLYDIRVLSTLGLTDADIESLESIEGVASVMPSYETDVMTRIDGEQYVIRVHSLDTDAAMKSDTSDGQRAVLDDETYLNRPLLESGVWPTKSGECVLSADAVMFSDVVIGDTVEITEGTQAIDDVLPTRTYAITGFVRSSYYTSSSSLGTTSLGSGMINQFMYVPMSDFSNDLPYTEAYVAVAGAKEENASQQAYADKVATVQKRIEEKAPELEQRRLADVKQTAQNELDTKKAEYEQEKTDALAKLDDARLKLDDALRTLDESQTQLGDAQLQLLSAESTIWSGQSEYDAGAAELDRQKRDAQTNFDQAEQTIASKQAALDAGKQQLAEMQGQLVAVKAQLAVTPETDPNYVALKQTVATLEALIPPFEALLAAGDQQLQAARTELDAGRRAATMGFADAQQKLDNAAAQIASGTAQLAQGRQDSTSGQQSIDDGRAEYQAGLEEYEKQKEEATQKFADAEKEFADAQKKIDEIDSPTWYIMDRTKNVGAESFKSDAARVDQIAQVFPLFFFLVAALVALTTMTRMVDEDRVLIGTFKALGYSKRRIALKYLMYAAIASGAGCVLGIVALSQLLPAIILNAYGIMYAVPTTPTPIDPVLALIAGGLGIGVTLAATGAAVASTLRESPAQLMLPRAPKAGKRILLERITPVWRHLSFSWKVTFRNIFRYKRRFIMTIIGIAGCTALLLTGLGLRDAINDIIDKQFNEIYHYNTTIGLVDEVSDADGQAIDAVINDPNLISAYVAADTLSMEAGAADKKGRGVSVIIPEDPADFQNFFTMRERIGHAPLSLRGNDVVVSEKLASELGLSVGDKMTLSEQDMVGNVTGDSYTLTVTGIMENYINMYVFLTPEHFQTLTGEEPKFATLFATGSTDDSIRSEISNSLLSVDSVKTVGYNDEAIDSYRTMLASVNSVVIVLVVAAATLAFVVLYNLTNINITERKREIATIKVLGFTPREVDSYIFREMILLTVIGCAVGLVLGIFMENFVVVTAEIDRVMFGREIHVLSFVIAFGLTLFFSLIVAFAMRWKLAKINMVESLKSNE